MLGDAGAAWLDALAPAARAALPRQLAGQGMRALVVAPGVSLADARAWTDAGCDVRLDDRPAHEIVHALRLDLTDQAPRKLLHGVLVDVHGVGLLLEGPSGAGKSALALELLARGHALVADDTVQVRRLAAGLLLAGCPPLLRGYLAARGLGVLDVRKLHGKRAVRGPRRLDLIVRLGRRRARLSPSQHLAGRRGTRRVLGEAVPVLTLPRSTHLAALVEAACLDQRLRLDGHDAARALERRQARAIKRNPG